MKPTGFEVWRGLSPLDSQPIVAIATLNSDNRKTGNMIQVWVLCQRGYPVDNARDGSDYSICGDCKHRLNAIGIRTCYVNPGRGLKVSTKHGLRVIILSLIYSTTKLRRVYSGGVHCAGVLTVILVYCLFISLIGSIAGLTRPQPTPINGGNHGRSLYGIQ